ncbi:MAG: hypothetical protein KDK78_04915 [Chlamydiia bacterium]|nr:hypothetical protein [Chlamydiia bacterium]
MQHLPVAQGIRDKFRLLGIESIGQLQEMEQKNLLRLFGDEAKPLIELARGVDLTPLHGIEVQEVLQETLDMDGVCSIEQVLEGLCVLLEGLFARLKQRHQLCSALRIASLERVLPIRIASPTAEVGRVCGLVREQLQHLHFMDAPERLTLTLEGLVAEYAQQLDFTEASAKRERLVHIQRVVERTEARGRACPLFHVGWLERSSRIPERRAYLQDLKDPCNTRPLLLPKPAQVTVNAEGIPFMLRMRAGWHAVEALVECWDLEDEWWEERPLMRSYYRVYLKNGAIVRLFRDRLNACWYRQSC